MARSGKASKGKRNKPTRSAMPEPQPKPGKQRIQFFLLAAALVALVGVVIVTSTGSVEGRLVAPSTDDAKVILTKHAYRTDGPRKLNELLKLSVEELADLDIALINLVCAEGLPGGENIDIDGTLVTLDQWAAHVQQETNRNLYKFRIDPAAWDHSEARWRMGMLVTVLQQDCGVHYNMDRVREVDFIRSQDLFIHGMAEPGMTPINSVEKPEQAKALLASTNGGTCVSMPVLYTAIARRLGYPVCLSSTQSHVFCRWDAKDHKNPAYRDYFNIEGTNRGINIYDDDHYLGFPVRITKEYADAHGFLVSQDNAQSLAGFMASRGHCLYDLGRMGPAYDAYRQAVRLDPEQPHFQQFLQQANYKMMPKDIQDRMMPPSQAERAGQSRGDRIDQQIAQINRLNAENRRRMDAWTRQHEQYNQQTNQSPGYVDLWPAHNNDPHQTSHQGF